MDVNSTVSGWYYDILTSIIAQFLTSRPFPDLCRPEVPRHNKKQKLVIRQMLTRHMLTALMKKETFAHNIFIISTMKQNVHCSFYCMCIDLLPTNLLTRIDLDLLFGLAAQTTDRITMPTVSRVAVRTGLSLTNSINPSTLPK